MPLDGRHNRPTHAAEPGMTCSAVAVVTVARLERVRRRNRVKASSTTVQGRDEENVVPLLEFVRLLALELPVRVVNENENSGAAGVRVSLVPRAFGAWLGVWLGVHSHVVVKHKQLLPRVLHDVLAEVVNQVGYRDGLPVARHGGYVDLVLPLVREEHLKPAAFHSVSATVVPHHSNLVKISELLS